MTDHVQEFVEEELDARKLRDAMRGADRGETALPLNASLSEVRKVALSQAAHDLKGNRSAEDVVGRAEVYLAFLVGAEAKS